MEPNLEGHRDGATYVAEFDYARLNRQAKLVYDCLKDGSWWSLRNISDWIGEPEASVSARLRDLRKPRFGSHVIDKRRVEGRGLYEYRIAAK